MRFFPLRCRLAVAACVLALCGPVRASAQAASVTERLDDAPLQAPGAVNNDTGPRGIVPVQRGFNASLEAVGQHDSSAGWQSILTPNVAWRFNRALSVNFGLPVFSYINVSQLTGYTGSGRNRTPTYAYVNRQLLLGDGVLTGTYEAHPRLFDYSLTASLGLPTGDDKDGLGAGQPTYNFNNHFEHTVTDWLTPDLELGFGNNVDNLNDSRARKDYNAVGFGAHFQAGLSFSLPRDLNFSTDAYEDLPLAQQTVTSVTGRGRKGKPKTTTTQQSLGEDNGFLNTLDIPINRHVTLSGFYNRSLRNHDDTAGMSFTLTLRPTPRGDDDVR